MSTLATNYATARDALCAMYQKQMQASDDAHEARLRHASEEYHKSNRDARLVFEEERKAALAEFEAAVAPAKTIYEENMAKVSCAMQTAEQKFADGKAALKTKHRADSEAITSQNSWRSRMAKEIIEFLRETAVDVAQRHGLMTDYETATAKNLRAAYDLNNLALPENIAALQRERDEVIARLKLEYAEVQSAFAVAKLNLKASEDAANAGVVQARQRFDTALKASAERYAATREASRLRADSERRRRAASFFELERALQIFCDVGRSTSVETDNSVEG